VPYKTCFSTNRLPPPVIVVLVDYAVPLSFPPDFFILRASLPPVLIHSAINGLRFYILPLSKKVRDSCLFPSLVALSSNHEVLFALT